MHARVRFPAALPPPELAQRPAVRRDTNADAAATDPYGRYPVRQASNDEPVRMPAAPAGQPTAAPPAAALPRGPSTSLPPAPLPNSAGAGRLPPPNTLPPSTTSPATPLQPAPTSAVAADAALRTPARAATTPSTGLAAGRPGEKSAEGPQAPTLVVEKAAPPEIQVGKPAVFEIYVRNNGNTPAHEVAIYDVLPLGTELTSTEPRADRGPQGELVWTLGTLNPGDEAVVRMELLPTTEGEIGSAATVRFAAAASVRTICTKPALVVDVQAPKSAMAGDEVPMRIRVSNPGTGVATGVKLTEVVPAGLEHDGGTELEYEVGDLQPGDVRDLDLVLRAVRPGQFVNLLHAKGDGRLAAETKTPIEITAPALALGVEGPKRRYLDRQATYTISISNPGTAAAQAVELATFLPKGMQFVEADNHGEYDAETHSVRWLLEELPPREQGSVTLTALPIEPGQQMLRIESSAERGVTARKEEAVMVEAAASIVFQVVDSADPIEVGGETTYEIVVANQGSKEATNVQLAVQLPEALKGLDAEGPAKFTLGPRLVQFQPLPQLAPKSEAVFRVRVQCLAAGDHRCHVQLLSDDMKTPVTKEEGTRVYADE